MAIPIKDARNGSRAAAYRKIAFLWASLASVQAIVITGWLCMRNDTSGLPLVPAWLWAVATISTFLYIYCAGRAGVYFPEGRVFEAAATIAGTIPLISSLVVVLYDGGARVLPSLLLSAGCFLVYVYYTALRGVPYPGLKASQLAAQNFLVVPLILYHQVMRIETKSHPSFSLAMHLHQTLSWLIACYVSGCFLSVVTNYLQAHLPRGRQQGLQFPNIYDSIKSSLTFYTVLFAIIVWLSH
jgi:hypothetical protein